MYKKKEFFSPWFEKNHGDRPNNDFISFYNYICTTLLNLNNCRSRKGGAGQ